MRCLPNGVSVSRMSGVALKVTGAPPRSTATLSASPALALMMRCMSAKLAIVRPLIERTRSPGWNPARSAALPACTTSMRGARTERPPMKAMPAKTRMASRKLATGPAATIAARLPTAW